MRPPIVFRTRACNWSTALGSAALLHNSELRVLIARQTNAWLARPGIHITGELLRGAVPAKLARTNTRNSSSSQKLEESGNKYATRTAVGRMIASLQLRGNGHVDEEPCRIVRSSFLVLLKTVEARNIRQYVLNRLPLQRERTVRGRSHRSFVSNALPLISRSHSDLEVSLTSDLEVSP